MEHLDFPAVPAGLVDRVASAFPRRCRADVIAPVVYDSVLDDEAAATRSDIATEQLLTFAADPFTLALQASGRGGGWRLMGQVSPAGTYDVLLDTPEEERHARSSEEGLFSFDRVDHGPIRVTCLESNGSGAPIVATTWVSL